MTVQRTIASGLAAVLLSTTAAFAVTELTVYTSVEAVDLDRYKQTFEKANPDIKINWVRDSTGIMTAKLLAEKNNPQADVVWGVAATSLLLLKGEGMLEAYAPAGVESSIRNSSTQPTRRAGSAWTPMWRRSATTRWRPRSWA